MRTQTSPKRHSPRSPAKTAVTNGAQVLGVDPGLSTTGWGVVTLEASPRHVGHGAITTRDKLPREQRLLVLFEGLRAVIQEHVLAVVAVEEPFVAVNVRSAFAIGEARAAALLAAAAEGLPVVSYSPAAVKETVTGYGRGEKQQVAEMVRLQLGLAKAPSPFDAADALAIALCHALRARLEALEGKREQGKGVRG